MSQRRVAITGLGVVTALGEEVETFWQRLLAGESGVRTVTRFDTSNFDVHFGGECTDFQPARYIDVREAKRLDRFAQFAVAAAKQAGRDSGLDFEAEDPVRVGVVIGTGIGGLLELEEQHIRLLEKGPKKVSAFTIPKLMVNAASGNISIVFGAQGPTSAVSTACASATNAIGDALNTIQRNEADVMFTGGAEAALTPLGLASFAAMRALSRRNNDPAAASRPFDRDRDGFVMGEGAGVLLLEEMNHARKRGARIYAELCGFGASGDASHITQPEPTGRGAALSMRKALADAGLNPQDIDYINAHGTGTPLGDRAETRAVHDVFGGHARKGGLSMSSTKSALGHLLGASGGVEMVATVLAMTRGVMPPTINLDHPDEQCDLDYVPKQAREKKITAAMSNSFGFGGHNASLVIRSCNSV